MTTSFFITYNTENLRQMPYIAYDNTTFKPLHINDNIAILCDLLHIEQRDNFTIEPICYETFLSRLTTGQIFKLYLNLGGKKSHFKTADEVLNGRTELKNLCRELIKEKEQLKNGFEIEIQARWIDEGLKRGKMCGYRYKPGSYTPVKAG